MHPDSYVTIRLVRGGAVAVISLLTITCRSEPTGPKVTATQLAFTVQPGNVQAGTTITVTVEARNASNQVDPKYYGRSGRVATNSARSRATAKQVASGSAIRSNVRSAHLCVATSDLIFQNAEAGLSGYDDRGARELVTSEIGAA